MISGAMVGQTVLVVRIGGEREAEEGGGRKREESAVGRSSSRGI